MKNSVAHIYKWLDNALNHEDHDPDLKVFEAIDTALFGSWFERIPSEKDEIAEVILRQIVVLQKAIDSLDTLNTTNPERYGRILRKTQTVLMEFHRSLEANWSDARDKLLSEDQIQSLGVVCDSLERTGTVPSELREELLIQADELRKKIHEAKLPDELRQALTANIESLRDSLIDYVVTGNTGLVDAIDRAVGQLIRAKKDIKAAEKSPLTESVWEFILSVDTVATKASTYLSLGRDWLPIALTDQSK